MIVVKIFKCTFYLYGNNNCLSIDCLSDSSYTIGACFFELQAGLTWRIASGSENLRKTKLSFHKTNYFLQKTSYLQIKHKTKFISLQAAKVYRSTYYESYFAEVQ